MSEQQRRAPWYRAVVQSLSAQVEVTLSDADERKLFELTQAMIPFRLWAQRRGGGTEVIDCMPGLAGFRYSVRPAIAIPVREDGTPASPEDGRAPAGAVQPTDPRYGSLVMQSLIVPHTPVGLRELATMLAPMVEQVRQEAAAWKAQASAKAPAKEEGAGKASRKRINGTPPATEPEGHASLPTP